jgi:hypothetical protein
MGSINRAASNIMAFTLQIGKRCHQCFRGRITKRRWTIPVVGLPRALYNNVCTGAMPISIHWRLVTQGASSPQRCGILLTR